MHQNEYASADIFENLVEGVKKNGIDIDGEVHMDFDSFTPRIQKKVSANV
jgi:GH35 family endo-1,4-beta-xylanase